VTVFTISSRNFCEETRGRGCDFVQSNTCCTNKLSSVELESLFVPCASVMETDERASSALGSRMEGVSGHGLYMTNDDIICFIPGTQSVGTPIMGIA
jgi:hypothetical protein